MTLPIHAGVFQITDTYFPLRETHAVIVERHHGRRSCSS